DHSIQILMAKYFSGASIDFYYWGQIRLGSLVPILLIIPVKLLGLHPLASAVVLSTAFYLGYVLVLGRYGWCVPEAALLPLAFVVLPVEVYDYLLYTGHPYGPSLFLSVAAFALLFQPKATNSATFSLSRYFASGLLLSTALWVSDTTV